MSNEIKPFQDPGLPEHAHRKADVDAIAANRAERQVAILFLLSAAEPTTIATGVTPNIPTTLSYDKHVANN